MDVSSEGLQMVKNALITFRSDINGIGMSVSKQSQNCLQNCATQISKLKDQITSLEKQQAQLGQMVDEMEQNIGSSQYQLQQIEKSLPILNNQLNNLYAQQAQLKNRLFALQAQLSNAESDEEKQQIQQQINTVQSQLGGIQTAIQETEAKIRNNEDEKDKLHAKINELSSRKNEYEAKLSEVKRTLNKAREKLDKLNIAYRNVQADFESYIASVQNFENSSIESADQKTKVVEECIKLVEDMESVF